MGKQRDAQWYNEQDKVIVTLPLEKSPYRKLYESAADMARSCYVRGFNICDIGCGTGRFAKALQLRGISPIDYVGFDFSKVNIHIARHYIPEFWFKVKDVNDPTFRFILPNFRVFVMLEFLEHIENDEELILDLPDNADIIFSVPDFDSPAHVRHFKDCNEVQKRYCHFFTINEQVDVKIGERTFFLFKAFK